MAWRWAEPVHLPIVGHELVIAQQPRRRLAGLQAGQPQVTGVLTHRVDEFVAADVLLHRHPGRRVGAVELQQHLHGAAGAVLEGGQRVIGRFGAALAYREAARHGRDRQVDLLRRCRGRCQQQHPDSGTREAAHGWISA
jgi:hypothetical protein